MSTSDYAESQPLAQTHTDFSDRPSTAEPFIDHRHDNHVEKVYSPMGSQRSTRVDVQAAEPAPTLRELVITDAYTDLQLLVEDVIRDIATTDGLVITVRNDQDRAERFFELLDVNVAKQLVQIAHAARVVMVRPEVVEVVPPVETKTIGQIDVPVEVPIDVLPPQIAEKIDGAAVTDAEDSLSASESEEDDDGEDDGD